MEQPIYNYIFGPVLSSRLGSSLGVDLLGENICSFDCLYCESGKTQIKTMRRSAYVPCRKVIQELKQWFGQNEQIEGHITLGGPGEPCLNSELGEIICSIKELRPDLPLAVLTNSSMLVSSQVRAELLKADVVLPSLDSLVEEEFVRINRPHPEIRLDNIVQGLLDFKSRFTGKVFLEVLVVPGINDSRKNLELLKDFQGILRPDRVDVTTMSRPGSYLDISECSGSLPDEWRREFRSLPGQKTRQKHKSYIDGSILRQSIGSSIRRRPQTPEQLAAALGADLKDILSMLRQMEKAGEVEVTTKNENRQKFYIIRG